ncbi:MAG TPA: hypothetical protein VJL59_11335, partial [Anaerolineales bacterium]|nr:hypothetical protein [Anaerolineales bacterium]
MAKKKTTPPDIFDLQQFYKQLGIAQAEQQAVTICFEIGLEHYYRHLYGHDKYGKRPGYLIEERMVEPYIFGFGAVEAVRQAALSLETRLKIVQCAFQSMDVTKEYGVPHGLPVMAAFLADAGNLHPDVFRSAMIAADFEGALFDDWRLDEARRLFEWLIAEESMPPAERIWWLWHICVNCEDRQMAALLADSLLTHRDITTKTKRLLCKAWLSDSPAGKPPAQWEALQALLSGDVDTFAARAAEAGLPQAEVLPSHEAIEAGYDSALDALTDGSDDGESPAASVQLLRKVMVGPLGMMVITPRVLKRTAILALPELGEDPLALGQQYLGSDKGYRGDVVNQAVAEVIRTYPLHFPASELRALLKR